MTSIFGYEKVTSLYKKLLDIKFGHSNYLLPLPRQSTHTKWVGLEQSESSQIQQLNNTQILNTIVITNFFFYIAQFVPLGLLQSRSVVELSINHKFHWRNYLIMEVTISNMRTTDQLRRVTSQTNQLIITEFGYS